MADCLDIGKLVVRAPSRAEPICHRFFQESGLGEMLGEQFRTRLHDQREAGFHHLRDVPVQLPPLFAIECAVQGLLEQRVLEPVGAVGRLARHVQNPGCHQLAELGLECRLVHADHGGQDIVRKLGAQRRGEMDDFRIDPHAAEPGQHELLKGGGDFMFVRPLEGDGVPDEAGEFLDEEGNTAGALKDLRDQRFGQGAAGFPARPFRDLAPRQAIEREVRLVGRRAPRRLEIRPEGEHGENAIVQAFRDELREELEARGIDPVQILDDEKHRLLSRTGAQPFADRAENLLPLARGRKSRRRIAGVGRQEEEFGEESHGLRLAKPALVEMLRQPVESRRR